MDVGEKVGIQCTDGGGEGQEAINYQTGVEVPVSPTSPQDPASLTYPKVPVSPTSPQDPASLTYPKVPVSPSSPQDRVPPTSSDMQVDAERTEPHPAARSTRVQHDTPPKGNSHGDTIVIKGEHGTYIEAKNLQAAMKPGSTLVLGHTNVLNLNPTSQCSPNPSPADIRNRYPLTVSQAKPEVRHLDVLSGLIGGEWRRLGRHLRLPDAQLQQLDLTYGREGQREVNYRMLSTWTEVTPQPTLQALAAALLATGRGDLADQLRMG